MSDLRKAAEMALETLEAHSVRKDHPEPITKTIQALRQALAQQEQELAQSVNHVAIPLKEMK